MEDAYEIKIWKRGYHDFCWMVRPKDSRFSISDGSGVDSKAGCEVRAKAAVEEHEAKNKAKWKTLI